MTFNSNGLIQYLILDTLTDGSKYGLAIIDAISRKTNGAYKLKKPTLYSCLTRLEKRGFVSSSYWGESELGGKRHYYSITQEGKLNLELNKSEFESTLNDYLSKTSTQAIIEDFSEEDYVEESPAEVSIEETKNEEEKPIYLKQENLFDQPKMQIKKEQKVETQAVVDNQIDLFSFAESQKNDAVFLDDSERIETYAEPEKVESPVVAESYTKIEEPEVKKDDAVFLDASETAQTETTRQAPLTQTQIAQNKRIYDTSSELKKYRNKKSFADNQIEIPVVYTDKNEEANNRARIEALKQSLLESKQSYYPANDDTQTLQNIPTNTEVSNQVEELSLKESFINKIEEHRTSISQNTETKIEETVQELPQDDGVFITTSIDQNKIHYQKKIAPPNIEISVSAENLPAPMRDSKLEPTYKDMVSKIMEKKRDTVQPEPQQDYAQDYSYGQTVSFSDFDSLKRYYASHGISFKEYKRTSVQRVHNTNFIKFILSTILLALSGLGSGIIYLIASTQNLLTHESNFLYYTIAIAFAIYAIVRLFIFKFSNSKKASMRYDAIVNWVVFALGSIVVLVVNICFGMQFESMAENFTSLIIPCYALLLIFPVNYYITKYAFKKFSK